MKTVAEELGLAPVIKAAKANFSLLFEEATDWMPNTYQRPKLPNGTFVLVVLGGGMKAKCPVPVEGLDWTVRGRGGIVKYKVMVTKAEHAELLRAMRKFTLTGQIGDPPDEQLHDTA